MDIQFYGANCVAIANKQVRIVVDDNLAELGGKEVVRDGDVCLYTAAHGTPTHQPQIVIDQPGEYEVSGVTVYGLQARSHIDEPDQMSATMYKIDAPDLRIVAAGHIFPKLTDEELETLGIVDVLIVPVGGNGYTLDGEGAMELIKKIEPKLVVPTHYADPTLKYPVPQRTLQEALQTMAMEPTETVKKLVLKPADLTDTTRLVVVERS